MNDERMLLPLSHINGENDEQVLRELWSDPLLMAEFDEDGWPANPRVPLPPERTHHVFRAQKKVDEQYYDVEHDGRCEPLAYPPMK